MDIQYLLLLQGLREAAPAWLNQLLLFVSEFAVGGLMYVYVLGLYWCVDKRAGNYLLFAVIGGSTVNQLVKNTACVYRPWIRDARVQVAAEAAASATGYSFPSGHTTNAAACYLGTAIWQRKHKGLVAVMIFLSLLTAFSRNWLGAHTPQDVCVALVLVSIFLLLSRKALAWLEAHPERRTLVLVLLLAFLALCLVYVECKPYPMELQADGTLLVDPERMKTDCYKAFGGMAALAIGWWADQCWLHFSVEGPLPLRVVRLAVGAAGFAALQSPLIACCQAGLGVNWGVFVGYFVLLLFAILLYPLLFTWVEHRLLPRFFHTAPAKG